MILQSFETCVKDLTVWRLLSYRLRPSSLPQVSERYESSNLLTALPSSFLEPLLSFTLMEDPEIRLLVLSILTSLIDRRHNATRLTAARSLLNRNNTDPNDQTVLVSVGKLGKEHVQSVVTYRFLLKWTGTTLWQTDVTAYRPAVDSMRLPFRWPSLSVYYKLLIIRNSSCVSPVWCLMSLCWSWRRTDALVRTTCSSGRWDKKFTFLSPVF